MFKQLSINSVTAMIALIALIAGTFAYFSGYQLISSYILGPVLLLGTLPILYGLIRDILSRKIGIDLIAGVALVSAFLMQQYFAGVIILLMLSGGESLEEYALARARKDISGLLSRAPHSAHVKEGGGYSDYPVEEVLVGMIVLVKPGEIIPVDGIVRSGNTFVDESTLTGESIPIEKKVDAHVFSGTVNANGTIEVEVTTPAAESRYSHIVKLVEEAEKESAPLVRLADKYSVYFTVITFIIAALAWFYTHDPIRILAVLVVATPCPLILATPIALVSGMSRASGKGFIIKSGSSLEVLARVKTFVFDKTGTLTLGTPTVTAIAAYSGEEDRLAYIAGSLEQLSAHVLATPVVAYAKGRGVTLSIPHDFHELFGSGVQGDIDDQTYYLGRLDFIKEKVGTIPPEAEQAYEESKQAGHPISFVADAKRILGHIMLADTIRPDSKKLFTELTRNGIGRTVMLTGDKQEAAERIAREIGISEVRANATPEDKIAFVQNIASTDRPVVMVGDGINDAPALAAADVGVALGAQGVTAASGSADVILVDPEISHVGELLKISRHTINVATQGIWFGIIASILCMIIAGLGFIVPVAGAFIQEGIDILVIFNALRVATAKLS